MTAIREHSNVDGVLRRNIRHGADMVLTESNNHSRKKTHQKDYVSFIMVKPPDFIFLLLNLRSHVCYQQVNVCI